jgi:hypothetical protein
MKKPLILSDGSCSACVGGWQCAWHQNEGVRLDRERGAMLRRVSANSRQYEIARVCSRFELESDEGGTREEKAERYMAKNL